MIQELMKNYKDIKGGILKYYDIYFWNEFDHM